MFSFFNCRKKSNRFSNVALSEAKHPLLEGDQLTVITEPSNDIGALFYRAEQVDELKRIKNNLVTRPRECLVIAYPPGNRRSFIIKDLLYLALETSLCVGNTFLALFHHNNVDTYRANQWNFENTIVYHNLTCADAVPKYSSMFHWCLNEFGNTTQAVLDACLRYRFCDDEPYVSVGIVALTSLILLTPFCYTSWRGKLLVREQTLPFQLLTQDEKNTLQRNKVPIDELSSFKDARLLIAAKILFLKLGLNSDILKIVQDYVATDNAGEKDLSNVAENYVALLRR